MIFLERPIPQFDGRTWCLVHAQAVDGSVQEIYVPEGASLDYWEELLTITTWPGEQYLSAQVFVDALDKMVKSRISDGTLEYSVSYDTEKEFMFEWSLVNDVAMLDQFTIA